MPQAHALTRHAGSARIMAASSARMGPALWTLVRCWLRRGANKRAFARGTSGHDADAIDCVIDEVEVALRRTRPKGINHTLMKFNKH